MKGYSLRLANGRQWNLVASEELINWLDKFASILGLKPSNVNGSPKLIFIRRRPNKKIPGNGWKVNNLGSVTVWSHPANQNLICNLIRETENNDLEILKMFQSLTIIYQHAQDTGGLLFHGGLIERNGQGVLLAAPGGTGKSTCCDRIPLPWRSLCDDESLIILDSKKGYQVHPFPTWSDYLMGKANKNRKVEQHLPLSAIFFLEQSEKDEATPIVRSQAALQINQHAKNISSKNLDKKKIFENSCEIAKAVPGFILRVSLNGEFWKEIERVL